MGFHSYRNIGFSFPDAEATCRQWRAKFSGFDPKGKEAYLTFSQEENFVRLLYFEREYRLNCENGVLEKWDGTQWTDRLLMNEALAVYYYLGDGTGQIRQPGRWVPESSLDPVCIRSNNRTEPLFLNFAAEFSGRLRELNEKCRLAGGVQDESSGDAAWIFSPFPQIPLKLVFWEKDDEFPAQVKMFVRENATDYVHYEAVSFMIADLFLLIDGVSE